MLSKNSPALEPPIWVLLAVAGIVATFVMKNLALLATLLFLVLVSALGVEPNAPFVTVNRLCTLATEKNLI